VKQRTQTSGIWTKQTLFPFLIIFSLRSNRLHPPRFQAGTETQWKRQCTRFFSHRADFSLCPGGNPKPKTLPCRHLRGLGVFATACAAEEHLRAPARVLVPSPGASSATASARGEPASGTARVAKRCWKRGQQVLFRSISKLVLKQCLECCDKTLICRNKPVVTGEATAGAKGTKLWRKMGLYPNCDSVLPQVKQVTAPGWKKWLCVLAVSGTRALLVGRINGLCAKPLSDLLQRERGGGDCAGPCPDPWLGTSSRINGLLRSANLGEGPKSVVTRQTKGSFYQLKRARVLEQPDAAFFSKAVPALEFGMVA